MGFFINTLVLRSEVRGGESFRELLGREREVVLGAYAHQEVPFEKLVEELQPERNLSHSPLFQVMFIMQNTPAESALNLGDLEVDPLPLNTGTTKYDLTLNMSEYLGSLGGTLQYNADLFEPSTIERMLKSFQTLLKVIASNPDERISSLPFLSEAERRRVLFEWNDTTEKYPRDRCIHQLFEAQAKHSPDAVAVVFEGRQLTYAELNRRANQLAHLLAKLLVGPEALVGICMDRSLEMLISVLGVLKAGGAYVPLDPLFPRKRLEFMLDHAGVAVLLTQQHVAVELDARSEQVICLERDLKLIEAEKAENPVVQTTPDNLAYVIYTSGSTGQPKGVQISHGSVINFLSSMRRRPGFTQQDTLLAVTTLSFDIAGLELFLPLMAGGRVVIAGRDALTDTARFIELIEESGATAMQATPAVWRLLLDVGWKGNENLRILCGGEALLRSLAAELSEKGDSLWNLFGPTETTIWSTIDQVQPGDKLVSIGKPIANTQVYVLSHDLQPVPIGLAGELYIGGDGLARGYLNAADATAQKFLPDPFGARTGARLYRTGDAARYLPDGKLEFLGRLDHQVKIRGHRIELGEIETALLQHPALREAVVVARNEGAGDKRLVAYIVAAREQLSPTVNELRRHLREQLPDYMLPAAFVILPALPLTANGKINRRALPAPEKLRPELETTYTPPHTRAERLIASVWQEVLGLEKVGLHDSFFDLGGHSLLTIQVQLKLREKFARELNIIDVFKYPTVGAMAEFLSDERDTKNFGQSEQERGAQRKLSMRRRREFKQRQSTALSQT
jgi:amino acid adenylation domain-containing protein